ncbi:hypothetical protein AURANDRAFT_22280 [Aureococcus anophagefferens]|uniref:RCK N-terminal domain-containing protein n=1 Tax=Aureococcus anophagefferens TaxID=44056 RepID=F0Y2D6_AURAN|nr:hypothetical protein AURANDRAFT_22280 [Aureococcus anophagefferens]EGB11092.1 hypothetical protein AURANDRAFT_22280 [Aureococcus anophagefferens]|eukprot:XP_009034643.1 hypothetical protein AURANDRAFT_22280 [Aureococcus anophagefferens]
MQALAALAAALVVAGALLLFAVSDTTPTDALWESLAGVGIAWDWASAAGRLDPGSARGVLTRVVAVAVSLGGMFVTALLLGIVSEQITEKVEHYRKGKSDVLESGHTVILGWSDKLFGVLEQLCLANESLGGGVVVLLSDKPKEEQEDALAQQVPETRGTTVICRQGSPLVREHLDKVSAEHARSVVVLSDDTLRADLCADQADARSLRVALSFVSEARHCAPASDRCIVMEMQDVDNEPLVQLVGGDHVETIVTHDLIGRLMIQSARHPGLAQVWSMLLGFDGCEFYIKHHAELDGVSFGDAFLRFDDAVPIGVIQGSGKDATIWVNPEDDLVLRPGDKLIVIAEDDDTYAPRTRPLEVEVASPSDGDLRTFRDDRALSMDDDNAERPECVLFCGWRRDMDDIVQVLDEFVTPGSELHIFCELPAEAQAERLREQRATRKRPLELSNLTVYHSEGLLCSRRDLEEKLPISSLSSIVILAEESEDLDATSKDSQALTTLLLLRDIHACDATDAVHAAIISEILDSRTSKLIADAQISDYVLSNDLVANALAMIAEDRTVNKLLKILMESEGSEFYIRRAADLVDVGRKQSFFDVMRAARLAFRGPEIAFGYVRAGEEPVLNPPRKRELKRWLKTDSFIVLAEG